MNIYNSFARENDLDLSGDFGNVLDILNNTRKNYFVTGKAGTGKSTLLQVFVNNSNKKIVRLAPTGIAAVNIQGVTIHSFFRFPPRPLSSEDIKLSRHRELYSSLDTIIIDEVSMVRADLMDAIDQFMRINGKHKDKPFGGVQMLFFGDIFQLQPVVASEEEQKYFASYYKSPYFFDAKIFNALAYDIMDLKKVFRQEDKEFIGLLDAVRLESINDSQFSELNNRYIPDYWPSKDDKSITLTSTNKLAADMNEFRLNEISDREFTFMGTIEGEFPKRSLPTEMLLRLKRGAQVMFVKNDSNKRWVNGTIGHIKSIKDDFIEVEVINNGDKYNYPVDIVKWEVLKYKYDYYYHKIITEVVGTFTQYPIKLAWAITIHKSQGLTFDDVIIDLGSGAFAHGQTYVALSRCTNLDGIILKKKIYPSDIIVDYPVKRFYSSRFL